MPRPIQYSQRANFAVEGKGTQTQPEAPKKTETDERRQTLAEAVLANIGKPDDLQEVQVKELHDENHYRVNVFRSIKGKRTMSNSYYVMMVEDGVVSSPPMDRIYFDDILEALVPTA
jgi:hypothetical protein